MISETILETFSEKLKHYELLELMNRKLIIHKQLEQPARTYVVYSDLHGSYEKFLHWLKNGLGHYQIDIENILGSSYSNEICHLYVRLLLIINHQRIKIIENLIFEGKTNSYSYKTFFDEPVSCKFIEQLKLIELKGIKKERIIEDLLKILRKITKEDEHRIIKVTPKTYLEIVLTLFFKKDRPSYHSLIKGITSNDLIFASFSTIFIKLSLINMFDKHINLGDTFDRGNDPDYLISLYKVYFSDDNSNMPLHYIWGNHDILWMGASIGSPMLCATALRISMRYNNVEFLYRYGFNFEKLRKFSNKIYHIDPTGVYGRGKTSKYWSKEESIKMTKVLLILEEKLTVQWLEMALKIPGHIDYHQEYNRHLELLKLLPTNIPEDKLFWDNYIKENPLYSDVYFPTINPNNPSKLTFEEEEIVNDMIQQFTTLPRFQNDLNWLFEKGETYRVVDNTLFFHAAIPTTINKEFNSIKGYKGKELLDFIQSDLKRIRQNQREGKELSIREKTYFWFLWCGNSSPFFCKSKMATLETAIFEKDEASKNLLTTWKEEPDPYYKYIRDEHFLQKIFNEFHSDNLCMGHVPVKGISDSILSDIHGAFIVDGGASEAYGDRGEVLIKSPDFTYVTMHPPLNELIEAEKNGKLPQFEIKILEQKKLNKIRDLDKGYFLKLELKEINNIINTRNNELYEKFFYE